MEFIETTVGSLVKYIKYLDNITKNYINESLQREELLKSFWICQKIIHVITINEKSGKSHQEISYNDNLNEIYIILRKIHSSFSQFITGSIFNEEKNYKSLKECFVRQELYLNEIYKDV